MRADEYSDAGLQVPLGGGEGEVDEGATVDARDLHRELVVTKSKKIQFFFGFARAVLCCVFFVFFCVNFYIFKIGRSHTGHRRELQGENFNTITLHRLNTVI